LAVFFLRHGVEPLA